MHLHSKSYSNAFYKSDLQEHTQLSMHVKSLNTMMHHFIICDRIYKKGSYTCTTSEHRFHHYSMDTSSDNQCVHVLWPKVHQSAFPEAAF